MFFNKIHSSSTERIISPRSSDNTFDIELQQPQPRRRQIFDHHEHDLHKNLNYPHAYSLQPIQQQQHEIRSSEPERSSSSINNIVTIPSNLPTISSSGPILIPSLPVVTEEK